MTTETTLRGFLAAVVAAGLSSCVAPGRISPSVVNRYQQTLADHEARHRGQDGLQPYQPIPAIEPRKLPVVNEGGRGRVHLSLPQAILRALANNVEIQLVSYDPAVAREEMVRAAAEFDYVLSGSYTHEITDERSVSTVGGGRADERTWQAGLKQKTVTGADWSLAWSMTRTWDNQGFRTLATRFEPRMTLQVTQPLLRDAWPEFNLARLRIARANRSSSEEAFRQKVEETVTEVISTYWLLVQSRRELEIQDELVRMTEDTRDRMKLRRALDVTDVEVQQSETAVAIRKATLTRTRNALVDVEKRLARLLADDQINALSDVQIVPVTLPSDVPVMLDPTDQLVTALEHNPILAQARLAIQVADINVSVARNQTLPRLELAASVGMQAVSGTKHDATEKFWTADYISSSIGVLLEYPIGNRDRIAQLRQKRYERLKAVATMQNTVDQIAVVVDERIRQVRASLEEMDEQQAAAEAARLQLRALEAREKMRDQLSPAFLQTKLQAQETLAEAKRGYVRVVVEYNVALVELERAKGTVLELNGVKLALPAAMGEEPWPVENDQQPVP